MSDFRDIEVKAGNQSFIVTTVVGILCMCLLLLNMKFNKDVKVYQPIEIAMNFEPIEIPEITIEEPIIQDNAISEEVANYGNSRYFTTPISSLISSTFSFSRNAWIPSAISSVA